MPSGLIDVEEYRRWMRQAEYTLASAIGDLGRGDYAWASFKAHQAAEYAAKALLRGLGRPAYGHSVSRLLAQLNAPSLLVDEAKRLDRHYLASRYPNQWAEGAPPDYYTRRDAEEAIEASRRVIEWVKNSFERLRRGGN